MKKIFIIFWGIAAVVVLITASSFLYETYLGQDETQLKVKSDDYFFSAKRNDVGVWKVDVKRVEDLWFAFGYIQMFDREFQMELLRNASLGKLSSIVGEKVLTRDRLMRAGARGAQVEWSLLDEKSLIRRSAQAFVDGVMAFKTGAKKPEPVEFQMLGMKRAINEAWSPWELLAIARYQAWQFSFDLEHEVFFERLKVMMNNPNLVLSDYFPRVGTQASEYDTEKLTGSLKSWKQNAGALKDFWMPREDLGPIESRIPVETAKLESPLPAFDFGNAQESWATLAASNAWIVSKPQKAKDNEVTVNPTLCNDTHLRMAWPSPLYPIQYDLDGKIQATGFTLPGVPGLVLGSLENNLGRRFAWAITLGNFTDTQDLIVDRTHSAKPKARIKERFLVRDAKTGKLADRVIEEKWTNLGFDVTDLYAMETLAKPKASKEAPVRVYLDWAGYRQLKNPIDFYIRRNLFLDEKIVDEIHTDWDYPVVNFNWMAGPRNGPVEVGHVITGLQYARSRKDQGLSLDSAGLSRRRVVRLGDEKYFSKVLGKEDFFMVSANQKPFTRASSEDAAYSWESSARADRIFDSKERIQKTPEALQTDYYSRALIEFFQRARSKVSANQICQVGTAEERDFCFKLWSKIEKWSGLLETNSWEASVISLWMNLSKQLIFPENYPWDTPEGDFLFAEYTQKGFSDAALLELMGSEQKVAAWEKLHKTKFVKRLGELFSKSLSLLVESRGPDAKLWTWGDLHRLDWYYPLGEAPKPWGPMIEESFLGPSERVGGGFDSPGSFEFQWSPSNPTEFPAVHGAAMRACYEFVPGEKTKVRWAVPNGPSGNPFSKWSRTFSKKSYFKGQLLKAE